MTQESSTPKKPRRHVVRFSVDGEDLTRIAREAFLAEPATRAYRILTNGLNGDGIEKVAQRVLDGRMKLTGNETDGIGAVECDDAEYVAQAKEIYAGRVRIDGSWWRPRAKVTAFGGSDAEFAIRRGAVPSLDEADAIASPGEGWAAIVRFQKERIAFFAKDGERVFEVAPVKKSGSNGRNPIIRVQALIFEPIGEPPFWWPENSTPTEALADFLAAGRELEVEQSSDDDATANPQNRRRPVIWQEGIAEAALLKQRQEERDQQETAREIAWIEQIGNIRIKVLEQAAGDFMELHSEDGKTAWSVPRAPFIHWALDRTSLRHMAPPWTPVSPSGLKLPLDNPNHSDWMIGGGIDLGTYYDVNSPIAKAANRAMFDLQKQMGDFACTVLVGGSDVHGHVGEGIVVLPNLHPDHLSELLGARGIITQAGGALAHLAQVALRAEHPDHAGG